MVFVLLNCLSSTADTSLTRLRHETRELLTEEATLDDESPDKDAAISSLCDLYVILRSDPRYASSDMLQGDAAKIRRRLINISTRRENRLERDGIEKPAGLAEAVDQAIEASLDQQNDSSYSADDGDLANGFAGAPLGSNPWQLVELIQRVIAPDLWDVHGGPGSIQYFAMRRVLVVRATTDVHEQIRDLLMALR
jgi:hypothetical protein